VSNPVGEVFSVQTPAAKTRLFWLIAIFLILAPVSVSGSTSREGDDPLKWARVIVLALVTLSGLRWLQWPRKGDVAGKQLALAAVFCAGALWSTSPIWGLAFKGMFVASVVAGISLANALRTEGDFRSFARTMTATSLVAIAGISYYALTQQEPIFFKGRLTIARINPNLLAQSASVFALLCVFHVLLRDTSRWMTIAMSCTGVMLALTVLSGSRGALLMLVAGLTVLLPAMGKRRRHVLFLSAVSGTCLALLAAFWFNMAVETEDPIVEAAAADSTELRILSELTKDTRMRVWRDVRQKWVASPVVGYGWLHKSDRWALVQSAYLQVLVETGIVGFFPLLVFLIAALSRILESLRLARRAGGLMGQLSFVFAATLFALLFHGAFESSAVTGASPNAVLMGFCVAQLDQLVRMMRHQIASARQQRQAAVTSPAGQSLMAVAGGPSH
jgi:O-antigen ligase